MSGVVKILVEIELATSCNNAVEAGMEIAEDWSAISQEIGLGARGYEVKSIVYTKDE